MNIHLLKHKLDNITYPTNLFTLFSFVTVGFARILNNGVLIVVTIIASNFAQADTATIGKLTYLFGVLTILTIITDLGMTEGLQKFVMTNDPKKYIGPSIILEGVIVAFTAVLVVLLDRQFGIFLGYGMYVGIALIASVYNIIILIFNGLMQQMKSSLYQIGYVLIYIVTFCILIFGFKNDIVASSLIGITIAWAVITFLMVIDLYMQGIVQLQRMLPRDYIMFCLNNLVYVVSFMIITQSDVLFLNQFFGETATGIYKATSQLGLIPRVVGVVIITPIFPLMAKAFKDNSYVLLRRYFMISVTVIFLSGFILSGLSIFLGSRTLDFLFANAEITAKGAGILPILILLFALQSCNQLSALFWQVITKDSFVRNVGIVHAVIFIIGMIICARWSIYSVAWVALAVELGVLINYTILYFVKITPEYIHTLHKGLQAKS